MFSNWLYVGYYSDGVAEHDREGLMANYECKYCGTNTTHKDRTCRGCDEKRELVRIIRAMLMPTYLKKQKRGKRK